MHIILNSSSMIPIYEQLVDQIKSLIINGSLKAGDALPSVRTMAANLKISALTVKKAYDFLESEGLTVTVHGKGTYVASTDLSLANEQRRRVVEEKFLEAIQSAKALGLSEQEIRDIVEIMIEQ